MPVECRKAGMRVEIERTLSYFTNRPEVVALYLFGSFDTSFERADSDIDVAPGAVFDVKLSLDGDICRALNRNDVA